MTRDARWPSTGDTLSPGTRAVESHGSQGARFSHKDTLNVRTDGLGFEGANAGLSNLYPRMERPTPPTLYDSEVPDSSRAELTALEHSANLGITRPYLASLPDGYIAEHLILEWIEFLVFEAGFDRTRAAFEYYNDIGWIGENAMNSLKDYAETFSDVNVEDAGPLALDHHRIGLVYIARFVSIQ